MRQIDAKVAGYGCLLAGLAFSISIVAIVTSGIAIHMVSTTNPMSRHQTGFCKEGSEIIDAAKDAEPGGCDCLRVRDDATHDHLQSMQG